MATTVEVGLKRSHEFNGGIEFQETCRKFLFNTKLLGIRSAMGGILKIQGAIICKGLLLGNNLKLLVAAKYEVTMS